MFCKLTSARCSAKDSLDHRRTFWIITSKQTRRCVMRDRCELEDATSPADIPIWKTGGRSVRSLRGSAESNPGRSLNLIRQRFLFLEQRGHTAIRKVSSPPYRTDPGGTCRRPEWALLPDAGRERPPNLLPNGMTRTIRFGWKPVDGESKKVHQ